MKMKHIALIGALMLPITLGACADLKNITSTISTASAFSVSQNDLDAARASYDGAVLVPLSHYAALPRCATGVTASVSNLCADLATGRKLRDANRVVQAAFKNVQSQIDAGNAAGISAAYSTLQTAITAAKGLVAAYGIA